MPLGPVLSQTRGCSPRKVPCAVSPALAETPWGGINRQPRGSIHARAAAELCEAPFVAPLERKVNLERAAEAFSTSGFQRHWTPQNQGGALWGCQRACERGASHLSLTNQRGWHLWQRDGGWRPGMVVVPWVACPEPVGSTTNTGMSLAIADQAAAARLPRAQVLGRCDLLRSLQRRSEVCDRSQQLSRTNPVAYADRMRAVPTRTAGCGRGRQVRRWRARCRCCELAAALLSPTTGKSCEPRGWHRRPAGERSSSDGCAAAAL